MTSDIVVVDYRTSNIRSVANMLRRIGARAVISTEPDQVRSAAKLILPGIGSFDAAVENLRAAGLVEALNEAALGRKVPILGICLGMQLFAEGSEEGELPGLGWIPGHVRRFDFSAQERALPIPHMGWDYVQVVDEQDPLFRDVPAPMRFYFVHSYHMVCSDRGHVLAVTHYGYEFASAVARDNIWGVQFHPEKSHKYGMQLLRNFVEKVECTVHG